MCSALASNGYSEIGEYVALDKQDAGAPRSKTLR